MYALLHTRAAGSQRGAWRTPFYARSSGCASLAVGGGGHPTPAAVRRSSVMTISGKEQEKILTGGTGCPVSGADPPLALLFANEARTLGGLHRSISKIVGRMTAPIARIRGIWLAGENRKARELNAVLQLKRPGWRSLYEKAVCANCGFRTTDLDLMRPPSSAARNSGWSRSSSTPGRAGVPPTDCGRR